MGMAWDGQDVSCEISGPVCEARSCVARLAPRPGDTMYTVWYGKYDQVEELNQATGRMSATSGYDSNCGKLTGSQEC